MKNQKRYALFIAGEPSGDEHCAAVLRELGKIGSGLECCGVGGPCMEREGFKPVLPFAPFNRMGIIEVLKGISFFIRAKKKLARLMDEKKPRVCVCVDYAGFNIPVMKTAKRKGIPVVWYITPKVWAWKPKRAEVIGKMADSICTIFPFETEYFQKYNDNVSYVGNPLVESLGLFNGENGEDERETSEKKSFREDSEWKIALIPGSRRQEVVKILGTMTDAVSILSQSFPDLSVRVSVCDWLPDDLYAAHTDEKNIEHFSGDLDSLLKWADFAFVTSGTATLHAALRKVPGIIVYKTGFVNYLAARLLVKMKNIGLPNIIAGREIVPELIQNDASAENLAAEAEKYLDSEKDYQNLIDRLVEIIELLGDNYPGKRVAKVISSCCG